MAVPLSLALGSIASLFVPTPSYPLIVAVGQVDVRIQDLLFGFFLISLAVSPRGLREAALRAARNRVALIAAVFFALALQSLGQVPSSHLAASATALGKLFEFAIVGFFAGVTVVASGAFLPFLAILAAGTSVNAAVSFERAWSAAGVEGLLRVRRDGLLGADVLAIGGAVTALGGLALITLRGRERPIAIAAFTVGLLGLLAGKSGFAAGAFFVSAVVMSLLVRQLSRSLAVSLSVVVLAVVMTARRGDVLAATHVLSPPRIEVRRGAEPVMRNLITNGGCEFETDGWNANGRAALTRAAVRPRFGIAACKVLTHGTTAGDGVFHNIVPVIPGVTYSLSAWINAPLGAKLALRLEWSDDRGRFLSGPYNVIRGVGRWTRSLLPNVRAPRTAAGARPTLYTIGFPQSMSFYVDGVQLEEGPTATPYGRDGSEPTANIVPNSGFETGLDQWNTNGKGVRGHIANDARYGSRASRIDVPGTNGSEGIFHNPIPVYPRTPYSLSAWVRGPRSQARLSLGLEWLGMRRQLIRTDERTFRTTAKWQRVILQGIRAPASAVTVRPTLYTVGRNEPLAVDLDAVQLEQRWTATPYRRGGIPGAVPPGGSVVYATGTIVHRLLVAYIGARIVMDHPWGGVGWLEAARPKYIASPRYERAARRLFPGADPLLYPSALPTHTHNAYLEMAADAGVLALIAFLGTLVSALWAAIRSSRRLIGRERVHAAIAAAMLVAVALWLNSNPLFGGSLEMGLFWCAVGISVAFALKPE